MLCHKTLFLFLSLSQYIFMRIEYYTNLFMSHLLDLINKISRNLFFESIERIFLNRHFGHPLYIGWLKDPIHLTLRGKREFPNYICSFILSRIKLRNDLS